MLKLYTILPPHPSTTVKKAQRMGIEKSCSIFINNRLTCIHDGSWQECPEGHNPGDFERLIKEEYKSINDLE